MQSVLLKILIAIIQSATEFLPISSSGHIALFEIFFGKKPDLFFAITLHLASLFAVIIFFRKEIFKLFSFDIQYKKIWLYLVLATLPAAVLGVLFKDYVVSTFNSLIFLAFAFMFTGTFLLFTKLAKEFSFLNMKNSLIIGIAQSFALFPGISRSGITTAAGLFLGIKKEEAVKFSFLLSVPTIAGAFILEIYDAIETISLKTMPPYIFPFLICFFLSIIFLNIFYNIVKKGNLWIFSFYCFFVGIFCLTSWLLGI